MKKNTIYCDKRQQANFGGTAHFQATKQLLNCLKEFLVKGLHTSVKMMLNFPPWQTQREINQAPQVKDKAMLLIKLMLHVERRFSEDQELTAQFLDLVNYIYRYLWWSWVCVCVCVCEIERERF